MRLLCCIFLMCSGLACDSAPRPSAPGSCLSAVTGEKCILGDDASCGCDAAVCRRGARRPWKTSVCVARETASTAAYFVPIATPQGARCFKEVHDLKSIDPENSESHTWFNTWDALDIGSPPGGPAGVVVAARKGKVIAVHNACKVADGSAASLRCGNSFGNHVLLLHADGEASFYSHLEKVSVRVGATVEQGDELGLEGATGEAGTRHVHFSVHRPGSGYEHDAVGTPGATISYQLHYYDVKGEVQKSPIEALNCRWDGTAGAAMYARPPERGN